MSNVRLRLYLLFDAFARVGELYGRAIISGMSTVHEAIVAHHCGIQIFAFSLITNKCILDRRTEEKPTESEVHETAHANEDMLRQFVVKMVQKMMQQA